MKLKNIPSLFILTDKEMKSRGYTIIGGGSPISGLCNPEERLAEINRTLEVLYKQKLIKKETGTARLENLSSDTRLVNHFLEFLANASADEKTREALLKRQYPF